MRVLTNCRKHQNLLLEEPLPLCQAKARYCLCCGHQTTHRQYDEYDLISAKYHIAYSLVRSIDYVRRERFPKSESLQEFICMELGLKAPVPTSTGYHPITITCATCHSIFRFHYTEQSDFVAPKHCVFCGSTKISTIQDNELDYFEVLGKSYGMAPSTIKLFFGAFSSQQQIPTFYEFMLMLKRQLSEQSSQPQLSEDI